MSLQRIDDALADWNRRLQAIADNLLWLQTDATYRMLTGSGGATRVPLAGATAARVQPALAELPSIFQNFDLLHSTIERAVEARKCLPALFGGDQKQAEIEHLLFGKSIKLSIVDVPLEQRTLLGQSQSTVCLSPEELLAPMERIFAAARDAVLAVERAWQDLADRFTRAEAQVQSLRLQGAALGPAGLAALDGAERGVERMREQLKADPLGALDAMAKEVQPALDKAAGAVAAMVQAQREMAQARRQLEEFRNLHAEAVAAAAQARAKIADCTALPAPPDERRLGYLSDWLDRVDRLLRDGDGERSAAELRNWKDSADDCVAQAKKIAAANMAPLEARRELRGRLDALKAKARARGVAERDGVADLAKKAEALIATRPTHLAEASEAVAAYANVLKGETGRP